MSAALVYAAHELFITDFVVDGGGNEALVNTIDVGPVNRSLGALIAIKATLNSNTDYAGSERIYWQHTSL